MQSSELTNIKSGGRELAQGGCLLEIAMLSVNAKLFEWHRLKGSIERTELELRVISRRSDPDGLNRSQELMREIQRLNAEANELLVEMEHARS
jgi:hypothetical protein